MNPEFEGWTNMTLAKLEGPAREPSFENPQKLHRLFGHVHHFTSGSPHGVIQTRRRNVAPSKNLMQSLRHTFKLWDLKFWHLKFQALDFLPD
ncbi:hypothetical protein PABG_07278 [Paracoccidioides brasiliensis Pb03]|nr:hypothetical protein PABG_07278 [Paracoccidioides brasiliensis Pb03]